MKLSGAKLDYARQVREAVARTRLRLAAKQRPLLADVRLMLNAADRRARDVEAAVDSAWVNPPAQPRESGSIYEALSEPGALR